MSETTGVLTTSDDASLPNNDGCDNSTIHNAMASSAPPALLSQQPQHNSQEQHQQKKRHQQSLGNKRHGARNQHRHKKFVKWIMDTFKEQLLLSQVQEHKEDDDKDDSDNNDQYHILDIAGGKGEVSARLTMCERQRVVMVDPRLADLPKCYETLVLTKIPKKWQQRVLQKQEQNPNFISDTINQRFQQLVTTFDNKLLIVDDESPSPSRTSTKNYDQQQHLLEAIEKSSLILGLHADSATETIVDIALKYNKAFVVVPCCVFPNFFQHRQIQQPDGSWVQVRSHGQFCQYLRTKDSRFQQSVLPFDGRNIAIWWDGK